MFAKVAVDGSTARRAWDQTIKWNFTRFLVGRGGDAIRHTGRRSSRQAWSRVVLVLLDRGGERYGEHR